MSYANDPLLARLSVDSVERAGSTRGRACVGARLDCRDSIRGEVIGPWNEMRLANAVPPLEKAVIPCTLGDADVLRRLTRMLLEAIGHIDQALVQVRLAREKDPLSMNALGYMAYLLAVQGEYELAIQNLKATLAVDPKMF